MKVNEQQWKILENVKPVLIDWSRNNEVNIFALHFVPMFDLSLEVYVFYENNSDIERYFNNGISNEFKQVFINELKKLNYFKLFNNKINFTFDSNENVIKNYQGSYFFRLR